MTENRHRIWGIIESAIALLIILLVLTDLFFDFNLLNMIYSITLLAILAYHFVLPEIWIKFDDCAYNRYKDTMYERRETCVTLPSTGERSGNILILFGFMLLYLTLAGMLNEFCEALNLGYASVFLIMLMCMLILNNIFKFTKFCLVKLIIFRAGVNCCNDCYVMGTDNILIFSALIYIFFLMPELNRAVKILSAVIIMYSVYNAVRWFKYLYTVPERFFPETNRKLRCKHCVKLKSCTGSKPYKYIGE